MLRAVIFAVAISYVRFIYAAPSSDDEKNDFIRTSGDDSVKITVFYESYCPHSVLFVVEQLIPAWRQFKERVNLDLVPFGNARQRYQDGHFKFECQHGPKECEANTLHACAIHAACGAAGTLNCQDREHHNLSKAVDYIGSVIGRPDPRGNSERCAGAVGLDASAVDSCASGQLGERLESFYGNRTKAFRPLVRHSPFVAINDKHTDEEQGEAQDDLRKVICKYIPDQCT